MKRISSYAWTLIAILWVVAMLNYLDRLLITSMREPIVASIPMTDAQFGLLTSVFLWVYGIFSPLGGFIADRYSRKWVIIFSVFIWSSITLWTGYVTSFEEMLAARAIMGISEACYIPAALALITDYHRGPTRSLATGVHISGLYAGMALGGLGGYIAEIWDWRSGFHIFGLFGILYSIILIFFIKENKEQNNLKVETDNKVEQEGSINFLNSLKALFNTYSFYILLFYNGIIGMAFWLINGWLPTFLREQFDLSLGEAGLSATGYIQIASFIGVIIGGYIADRWSKINKRGRLYLPIIGFMFGAPFLYLMGSTAAMGFAIICMIIFGLSRGFHDSNLMPILCQVIDVRYRATGYGFLNFFSTIIGGLTIYIGGILRDGNVNLSLVFQIAAISLFVFTLLLFFVRIKQYCPIKF